MDLKNILRIDEFFKNPEISGLDYDMNFHDMWELAERTPKKVVLLQSVDIESEAGQRLLAGDWPKKRNIIIQTGARSVEEGKEILKKLRQSVPV